MWQLKCKDGLEEATEKRLAEDVREVQRSRRIECCHSSCRLLTCNTCLGLFRKRQLGHYGKKPNCINIECQPASQPGS